MDIIANVKVIAETITTICAAIIVLKHLVGIIPKPIKIFFSETVPVFFCGIKTDNKKIRFFKALKVRKEQQRQFQNILKGLCPDCEREEIFILNKDELCKHIYESNLFTRVVYNKEIKK